MGATEGLPVLQRVLSQRVLPSIVQYFLSMTMDAFLLEFAQVSLSWTTLV